MGEDEKVAQASVSLFSSAGIGDLGIEYGCGIPVAISAELVPERAALIRTNYPDCKVVEGDLRETKNEVISTWKSKNVGRPLLVTLSPPCQGMSTNGAGKIAAQVRKGKRPKHDERNKLLVPGLEVVKALQPEFFLIENVPHMKNTIVEWKKKPERLLDLIKPTVGKGYEIHSFVLDFADYGVPHHRKRLITIGRKRPQKLTKLTEHTSAPQWFDGGSKAEWVTVKEAIGNHVQTRQNDLHHRTPSMNEKHVLWASYIPKNSGKTAHLNRCVSCKFLDDFKIVTCSECGKPLQRPHLVEKDGTRRAIKGYKTSYRRMLPNQPANTITMNSGVASSDVKLHYSAPRVLTLLEIMILSSIKNIDNLRSGIPTNHPWNGKYSFEKHMRKKDYPLQKNLIRQALGESIPPLAMQRMVSTILNDWP